MAPNRKNVALLIQSLGEIDFSENLNVPASKTYLPLTHPQEATSTSSQKEEVVRQSAHDSESYWDWPSDIPSEPVDIFSASHIEKNLIKASQQSVAPSALDASNDEYWAEAEADSAVESKPTLPQHVDANADYWTWETKFESKKDVLMKDILASEEARELTSAAHIEQMLIQQSPAKPTLQVKAQKPYNDAYWTWESPKVASHTLDASHPNHDYWTWHTKIESDESKKAALISYFVEHEKIRQMLSADHIIENIASSNLPDTGNTLAEHDEYWNDRQYLGDEYWSEQPPAVTTGSGYWDW